MFLVDSRTPQDSANNLRCVGAVEKGRASFQQLIQAAVNRRWSELGRSQIPGLFCWRSFDRLTHRLETIFAVDNERMLAASNTRTHKHACMCTHIHPHPQIHTHTGPWKYIASGGRNRSLAAAISCARSGFACDTSDSTCRTAVRVPHGKID